LFICCIDFYSTTRGDSNISVHFRNLKSWSPYTARERLTHTWKTRRFSAGRSWYCFKVADSCAMNIYKRRHAFDVARTLFFLCKVDSFNCTFTNGGKKVNSCIKYFSKMRPLKILKLLENSTNDTWNYIIVHFHHPAEKILSFICRALWRGAQMRLVRFMWLLVIVDIQDVLRIPCVFFQSVVK